ncbi:MAG: hypothetical protein U1E39_13785 [Planctomycetota bacterium]
MRTTWIRAVLSLLVAGTLAGCCRRCPPCSPTTVASGFVPGHRELPDATRQAVVRRLRVGMTIDEVRAVLRPFADSEPHGLGGHGWVTFGLREGSLLLHFDYEGGTTSFGDGPAEGMSTDQVPAFLRKPMEMWLALGGDFAPDGAK